MGICDATAEAKFDAVPAIVNAEKSGSIQALREGSIGLVFSINNYMVQCVKKHATGITAASAGHNYTVTEDTARWRATRLLPCRFIPQRFLISPTTPMLCWWQSHGEPSVLPMVFAFATRPLANPNGQGLRAT